MSLPRRPTAACSFIILCSFPNLVRSHFLTAAPYNETHNHYCSKVSCSNPLPNDFPLPRLSHHLAFPFPCSNYTLFVWPPGCAVMQRRGVIKMIYKCNPPPPPPATHTPTTFLSNSPHRPLSSCPLAPVKYDSASYHPPD